MGSSRKSKKSKKKHRKESSSSSSDSSSNEEEWVEISSSKRRNIKEEKETKLEMTTERDEWMSDPVEFSGFTRDQLRKKEPKEDESKYMLDRLGQSDRELNPYWKDGGSGLPKNIKELNVSNVAVGDHGVEWLRKALRRAKEQAAEEGRRLEDVVAERWGSLEKLESMIQDAESRTEKRYRKVDVDSYGKYKERKRGETFSKPGSSSSKEFERSGGDKFYHRDRSKDVRKHARHSSDEDERNRSRSRIFMKPHDDSDNESHDKKRENREDKRMYSDDKHISRNKSHSNKFMKPSDDDFHKDARSDKGFKSESRFSSSGKGWRKQPLAKSVESEKNNDDKVVKLHSVQESEPKCSKGNVEPESSVPVYLTADERNELAAKIIKAEILGNADLVNKLKSKLEQARSNASEVEKTVVLTVTDSKGFTQPLALSSEPDNVKRRKEKTKTHEGGKRVRYFADDDKYSLQQMFEREKRSTVEDQNEMFARLASKNVGRDESANDMDDVFEDMVRIKEADGKTAARERNKAIDQHRRSTKALDNCQWCLDGKRLLKHLVVTIGSKLFLCLPPHESLTEGHCLLVPSQHVPCATQLDEDVWEEFQVFKKALVKMFLSMDMDVIFFENAMYLSHTPHMVLQCVPLPKESGDLAPIYFKKAILECETEWASNKKLIDLAGKNVRRAVPQGLPYFSVDFGMQPGYAHVIEDEKLFPKNFAQEIIGGMIDADHSLWRKPKLQKFEEQRKKVIDFIKMWKPYNVKENITL